MTKTIDTTSNLKDNEPSISLGNYLQRERQKKKLSLKEIATATKVPEEALEAIESGNKKLLPVAVFAKGFVKIYSGHLGLDQNDILKRFQKEWDLNATDDSPEMLHEETMAQISPFYLSVQFYIIIAAVVLLLGLAYFFFNANDEINTNLSLNNIREMQTLPTSIIQKDEPISIAQLKNQQNQQPLISPKSAGKLAREDDDNEDVIIASLPSVIIVQKHTPVIPVRITAKIEPADQQIIEILPEDIEQVSPSLTLPLDLHIAFLARTRISISQDEASPAKYIFSRGEESNWIADKTISMQVEKAENVRITLNGKIISFPHSEGTPLAITLPADLHNF